MLAAFFHDERFTRDASGTYYSTGALPYRTFARYLKHFDRVIVVGRLGDAANRPMRTVASGERLEWACIAPSGLSFPRYVAAVSHRAHEVLARVDCAIVRLPSLIGTIACREALASGTPWVAEVVGDAFESLWNHGSWKGMAAAVPMYLLSRHYVGRAPFAIYVTTALQRRYPPRGTWVAASNVAIDPPRGDVLARRIARIEASREHATLGLVGSYDVHYKGHEIALRALALLNRRRPVTLRCIGVGDPSRWRKRAEALGVGPLVEFGAALPHGAPVLEWMDGLDVCIVPSLTEGLPRCLVEAMSRALPAVASRAGGIPELLDARWIHRRGDDRDLARLVDALLGNREEMKAQARRNWRTASDYAANVLEERRDWLFQQFKAAIAEEAGASGVTASRTS